LLLDEEMKKATLKVHEKLKSSEILYESGQYGDSVSISYYVMYTTAKILLFLKGIKPKTHKGLMQVFSKEYVHENDFNRELFKKFAYSQSLREQADYEFIDDINEKIAKNTLNLAKSFVKEASRFFKDLNR